MLNNATLARIESEVGKAIFTQLVTVFLKDTEQQLTQLNTLTIESEDMLRACHSLKSTARSYGAEAMGEMCAMLETLHKEQQFDDFKAYLPQAVDIISATINATKLYLNELG
jgi:HPt (histidine-containing phosphotransfer) domain-containing protein